MLGYAQSSLHQREMETSIKNRLIKPIPKQVACSQLKHWWLITMLTTLYKIMAKMIATRMTLIVVDIISPTCPDPVCSVYIFIDYNVRIDRGKERNMWVPCFHKKIIFFLTSIFFPITHIEALFLVTTRTTSEVIDYNVQSSSSKLLHPLVHRIHN